MTIFAKKIMIWPVLYPYPNSEYGSWYLKAEGKRSVMMFLDNDLDDGSDGLAGQQHPLVPVPTCHPFRLRALLLPVQYAV